MSILPILNSTQERKLQHIGEYLMVDNQLHSMDICFPLLMNSIPKKDYYLFKKICKRE
jgi:hypothetical protein